jgi:hypothetical protein
MRVKGDGKYNITLISDQHAPKKGPLYLVFLFVSNSPPLTVPVAAGNILKNF